MLVHSTPQVQTAITPAHVARSIDYAAYRAMIDPLLSEGKTTGIDQSAKMVDYTKLNLQRVERLEKTVELSPETVAAAQSVVKKWIWLALTEWWCGDAAQNLPVIAKIAALNPNIDFRILLRDENLDVMDAYLTNGGRSIPILVCLEADTLREIGRWGPRPQPTQVILHNYKANPSISHEQFIKEVQLWYSQDKAQTIQKEFIALINAWSYN